MIDAALVATAFVVVSAFVIPIFGLASALYLFCAMQTVMAVGTLTILDRSIPADDLYRELILMATLTLYGWSIVAALAKRAIGAREMRSVRTAAPTPLLIKPNKYIWIPILSSIAICALYFMQVGGLTFLHGLRAAFTGTGDATDIATMRLSAYAGDQYFAPGYVNQFKNSLLPALVAVVITYRLRTHTGSRVFDLALALVSALFLLGTGQRGAFVLAVLVVLVYLYWLGRRRSIGKMLLVALVGILLFSLASVANLRQSDSTGSAVSQAVTSLWKRGMEEQQGAAVAGFRYIFTQPITNGREWLEGIKGVLPGPGGSSLASEIFATVYGSGRGTMPPSIWGSIYHNFGYVGVVAFVPIFVAILAWVSGFIFRDESRNTVELVGVSGVTVYLGTWVAGDPMYLLNSGIIVYVALWWAGRQYRITIPHGRSENATTQDGLVSSAKLQAASNIEAR